MNHFLENLLNFITFTNFAMFVVSQKAFDHDVEFIISSFG